jgi:hypothetical protein
MRIFIDDERMPSDDAIVVRDFAAFKAHVRRYGFPKFISFDHDLGDGQPSSFDIAKWIVANDIRRAGFIPADFTFYVHSQNPVGAENIRRLLDAYLDFRCARAPELASAGPVPE